MKNTTTVAVIITLIVAIFTTTAFAGTFEYIGEDSLGPIQKKTIAAMFTNAGIDLEKADVEIFGELMDDMPYMEGVTVLFVRVTLLYKGEVFTDRGGMAPQNAFEVTKRNGRDVIQKATGNKSSD